MFSLRSPNVVLPLIGRCLHVVPILPSCCSYVFLKFFSRCRHVVLMSSSRSLNFVLALKGRCLHVVPTFLSHSSLIVVCCRHVVSMFSSCCPHVVLSRLKISVFLLSPYCLLVFSTFSLHSPFVVFTLSPRCLHVVPMLSFLSCQIKILHLLFS